MKKLDVYALLTLDELRDNVDELCDHFWEQDPVPHQLIDEAERIHRKVEALMEAVARA